MSVELRTHSAFSFGDGAASPEQLVRRARRLGYSHLAITDTADLGGLVRMQVEARQPTRDEECPQSAGHAALGNDPCPVCERPIAPIAGASLAVDGAPAAFLARDAEGYRNLATLVTLARMGGWAQWTKAGGKRRRGRPGITFDQLASHAAGLHALTGPANGVIASRVLAGDDAGARALLERWRDLFGARLAVEVQLHDVGGHEAALAGALVALAESCRVPWMVAQDARYVDADGRLVHDVLTALRHACTLDEAQARGLLRPNGDWTLRSPRARRRRWLGREEGLRTAQRIARECEPFDLAWMRPPLPDFAVPGGGDIDAFLRAKTLEGARERWGASLTHEQSGQLEKELRMIAKLGFSGFFLVMWDAIRFARSRNILCQGRGSAANSAVAYCLGITAVDPVKHGLLFERFISEIRVEGKAEAPDIDVDFEHERREEVLDYVYEHWGRSRAAITAVTQMYRAPNAIRDAMRAFGYEPEFALRFSKRLHWAEPRDAAETIRDTLGAEWGLDVTTPKGKALLRAIAALDGVPRMRSTHVGGFVISAGSLGAWLPVEQTSMGRTILQFDKDDLDEIGVPKFDFLGLGALTAVRKSYDIIEMRTGVRPHLYDLPTEDHATYEMIARGETIGTFQIESRAQIASILRTKPERLYDIVVQVALIRPGPIQARFVTPYTNRRLGLEPVEYRHPALEPILKRTQGIPIFQEQAMAIAMTVAGYSGSEADALRRSMGNERKKDRLLLELEKLRVALVGKGIDADTAELIREDLIGFANYGFPESHAWSFALIAFATCWLKAHHPEAFFAGVLNAQPMGFYPVSALIHDARRFGVIVLPPCLHFGGRDAIVEDVEGEVRPALRLGWRLIRGSGDDLLDRLEGAKRERPFASIGDVVERAMLERGEALALARAGAFSHWADDRRHAAWEALRASGDVLPLAPASHEPHQPAPMSDDRLVLLDYHMTGLSVNGHPMGAAREWLARKGAKTSRDLKDIPNGRTIAVAGLVTIRQKPATAGGTIFLLLEDEWGFINVVVNKTLVEENAEVVKRAPYLIVQGRLEKDGAVINVVGKRFKALEMEGITFQSRDFR
ncbi:MAG: DNA polymerase III subunit alpha [Gemmatimonadaceae bacterium]